MNSKMLSEWLTDLPLIERAQKLSKLSHDLTICAREFRSPSISGDKSIIIKKLLGFSELHHKISAQVGHYCAGEEIKVYPVEVLVEILFDIADHHEIVPFLDRAIYHTRTGSWQVGKDSAT
jgi:hypothetical protein